ncbi:alpha/beta-hydrolase [Flammula alnicola]|nr:alpha/beta-hydrolase [Flammula alnicola]
MLLASAASLLVPLVSWLYGDKPTLELPHETPQLRFELRHAHAVSSTSAHVIFSDVSPQALKRFAVADDPTGSTKSSYGVRSRLAKTYRPSSFAAHSRARLRSLRFGENEWLDWEEDEIMSPDVENREALLELAKMTNNAYVEPDDPAWYDLNGRWNITYPFGWEPEEDGFRGHVFATPDNSTIVISIKGTSAGVFGSGGTTAKRDKLNDNLLFSCCCARIDWTWTTVCGCYRGGWKCDQTCLEDSLIPESLFYPIGTNLYNNVTYMYPNANIWMTGHSLGGALSSLIGVTFGLPVVTFEAPGERLAATRLHLPSPPSTHHVTHVYHTADPIAMGTCNGVLSSCALGGYALETACHLGQSIVYDTVSNASWTVDIRTHGIVNVIEKLLSDPWPPSVEVGLDVPKAAAEVDCVECFSWEFGDFPA